MRLLLVTPLFLASCLGGPFLNLSAAPSSHLGHGAAFVDNGYKGRFTPRESLLAVPAPAIAVKLDDAENNFDPLFFDDGDYVRFVRGIGDAARRFPRPNEGPPLDRERYLTALVTRFVVRAIDGRTSRPEPYAARPIAPDPVRDVVVEHQSEAGPCRASIPPRALLQTGGLDARFVLVLDDIEIGYSKGSGSGMSFDAFGKMSMEPHPYAPSALWASARYMIYDYAYRRVVSCGVARGASAPENQHLRRVDWDLALADLAQHVVTPF